MAESSSPTGRTLRPRNTSAVFGYWNALTWTRRWHGRAKASPPLGGRSRGERSFSIRQPTEILDALGRLLRQSAAILIGVLTLIVLSIHPIPECVDCEYPNPWRRNDAVDL